MFTGLIEDLGTVKRLAMSQISVETKLGGISAGDSIVVNGACLTAVSIKDGIFTADYSPKTDKVTALSYLKADDKVNLERALSLSSRLGGHIVSGHVDGKGEIEKVEKLERFYIVRISLDDNCMEYCIEKDSMAVDGISLTISKIAGGNIEICIIPETFAATALRFRKKGDKVNIETDILAKYVKKFIKNRNSNGISFEMVKGNGFI